MQEEARKATDPGARESSHLREELKSFFAAPWPEEGREAAAPESFNRLALEVFRHQLSRNPLYAAFVRSRVPRPEGLDRWEAIPPVPSRAFKEFPLVSGNPRNARLRFQTSGTTRGERARGQHLVLDPELYRASLLPNFRRHLLPEGGTLPIVSLLPSREAVPESSLSFMMDQVMAEWGGDGSGFYADPQHGVDTQAVIRVLEGAVARSEPVLLAGTAFGFVHWMDALDGMGWRVVLPEGSRIMETGGFKGRSREVSREVLYRGMEERLGVPSGRIVNEYGMTELLSQFYEPLLWEAHIRGGAGDGMGEVRRYHVGPPWLRTRVLHPETLAPVPPGEAGLLCHLDLANLDSVACVLTEDLGVADGEGFRLLGRAPGSEPRGCSLTMEALLEVAGS